MIVYMDHPLHGAMAVNSEAECAAHEANGWVKRKESTVKVKAPAKDAAKADVPAEAGSGAQAAPGEPEHDYTPVFPDGKTKAKRK